MEITKREVLASISIVCILLIIGVLIADKISEKQMDRNEKYNKALKIKDVDMFKYGMRTNVGNAFVYGELEAVDPVSYPEVKDKYLHIERVTEKYTMHTRTVTQTVNGKTTTKTQVYWSWDVIDRESLTADKVKFLGVDFKSNQFELPYGNYIDTVKKSSTIRYKFYGYPKKSNVTIFTKLSNNNIESKGIPVYENKTIEETMEDLVSNSSTIVFWVLWIIVIIGVVYGFYYLDNKWLE